jgi:hypothetical protein
VVCVWCVCVCVCVVCVWSEGIQTSEIYIRMLTQYSESCMEQVAPLLYSNARPYLAAINVEAIRQLKFEPPPPPAQNSPDLAQFDYHMFSPLKEAFRRRRFASNDKVLDVVHTWFRLQRKTLFAGRIRSL